MITAITLFELASKNHQIYVIKAHPYSYIDCSFATRQPRKISSRNIPVSLFLRFYVHFQKTSQPDSLLVRLRNLSSWQSVSSDWVESVASVFFLVRLPKIVITGEASPLPPFCLLDASVLCPDRLATRRQRICS